MNKVVFIDEVRFHAFHGVMPQERAVGADFTVSLRVEYDFTKAAVSDDLADTISYADLFHVMAARIVKAIASKWPQVQCVDIRLRKDNPPMGADCKGAGVELHFINK